MQTSSAIQNTALPFDIYMSGCKDLEKTTSTESKKVEVVRKCK